MKKINIKTLHWKTLFELNIIENWKYIKQEILCFSFLWNMIKYYFALWEARQIYLTIWDEFYFNKIKKY
jgi:hypothetical protein